jgi:hypothetical protein
MSQKAIMTGTDRGRILLVEGASAGTDRAAAGGLVQSAPSVSLPAV